MGDLLIKNGRVWPAADRPVIEGGSVLVKGGRIARVGRFKARAAKVVDAGGALVMPGLVQGHIHLCQTMFRGAAEDLALLPWLRHFIWPLEAAHDPDSLHASAALTCAELVRGGTTAFFSMETVRHTDAVFRAVDESGLMGHIGHCLMDDTGGYKPLAVPIGKALEELDELRVRWGGHDRIRPAVAPRFALSCSSANMKEASAYARAHGLRLHTHASEQREEVELVLDRTGMHNIRYLSSVGLTGPDVGIAHCVHTEMDERALLRESGSHVLHCPSANLKLASGIAPIPEYLESGIHVSIGGDGAPCNNRLDQFLEMREAALLQKIRLGPEALPARAVVRMATEGGARLLGMDKEMGTLDPGKRANLIVVDQDSMAVLPSTDVAANVVYTNLSSDVRMTVINGEILFADGELKRVDEEKIRARAKEQRKRLFRRARLS